MVRNASTADKLKKIGFYGKEFDLWRTNSMY
jgi:hypothetical protein